MPSKSPKQAKLMRAVAHNRGFAKKVGVPTSVGKDFVKADKRKFRSGATRAAINTQDTRKGKLDLPFAKLNKYAGMAEGGDVKESKKMMMKELSFMKKKGAPKSMIRHEEKEMGGKPKGKGKFKFKGRMR
jgi:hypothetical protein